MSSEAMLITAIGAMAGVIAVLWGIFYGIFKAREAALNTLQATFMADTKERLKECEDDRKRLWEHVERLEKGCEAPSCPMRDS